MFTFTPSSMSGAYGPGRPVSSSPLQRQRIRYWSSSPRSMASMRERTHKQDRCCRQWIFSQGICHGTQRTLRSGSHHPEAHVPLQGPGRCAENCASLALYRTASDKEKQRHLLQLASAIKLWAGQYGSDPSVDYESQSIIARCPELKQQMQQG